MNERIQELLVQSNLLINVSEYRVNELDPNIKKFAELIVFDAIAKIESVGFKSSNDIPFEITDLFVSQIKQHFGVE